MRPQGLVAAVAATVTVVLAGCSSTAPAGVEPSSATSSWSSTSSTAPLDASPSAAAGRQLPAGQWPDACSLLSPEEAARVVGAPVGQAQPGPPPVLDGGSRGPRPGSCAWATADGATGELRIVDVVYPVTELWASIRIGFPGATDLDGVARQAFVAQRPDGGTSLMVCQGRTIFEVAAPVGATVDQTVFAEVGAAAAQRVRGPAAATT